MKIYEFEFNCDKETAIEEILSYTEKPVLLFEQDVIYARRIGSLVSLHHGISYRNSFRPILKLHFKEVEPGKTIAKGIFRWNWLVTLFSVVWVSIVVRMFFILKDEPGWTGLFPIFFILFFVALAGFSTFSGRKNRRDIIDHIKWAQGVINNK